MPCFPNRKTVSLFWFSGLDLQLPSEHVHLDLLHKAIMSKLCISSSPALSSAHFSSLNGVTILLVTQTQNLRESLTSLFLHSSYCQSIFPKGTTQRDCQLFEVKDYGLFIFLMSIPSTVSGRYTVGAQKMLAEWMTDCPIDTISVIALFFFFSPHSSAFILGQILVIFDLDS